MARDSIARSGHPRMFRARIWGWHRIVQGYATASGFTYTVLSYGSCSSL
jgi:hypothetical protein